jgi:hypothetical protein
MSRPTEGVSEGIDEDYFQDGPTLPAHHDSSLAVDGLSDLFTTPALANDPTLATGDLGDLFQERNASEDEDSVSGCFGDGDDASMTAASEPVAMAASEPVATNVTTSAPAEEPAEAPIDYALVEFEPIFESDEGFQSDTQRAAQEFERFAEKFHAFASECQQRVAATGVDPARLRP